MIDKILFLKTIYTPAIPKELTHSTSPKTSPTKKAFQWQKRLAHIGF
jgi:hypothetical protein